MAGSLFLWRGEDVVSQSGRRRAPPTPADKRNDTAHIKKKNTLVNACHVMTVKMPFCPATLCASHPVLRSTLRPVKLRMEQRPWADGFLSTRAGTRQRAPSCRPDELGGGGTRSFSTVAVSQADQPGLGLSKHKVDYKCYGFTMWVAAPKSTSMTNCFTRQTVLQLPRNLLTRP